MSLRLGFHYHIPMTRDAEGRLRTPGYQGRFLDSLARHCEQLVCFLHSPSPTDTSPLDYVIQSDNVVWVDIGAHASVPRRMLGARKVACLIRPWRTQLDAMLIRGPSPLLPVVAGAVDSLPTSLLLVGDYLAGIDDLPQPRWRKEAIRLWARWNYHQQMKVARRSLTFVNSRRLYNELRPFVENLVETRTTTLTSADFYEREDTCTQRPIRLLYTGRMDRAKGLLQMVEALALLVDSGEDVVLDLVGWPQKGDPILDEVQALARGKGVAERVFYHGYKPVGPELFAYYKQADIYVIASMSSEGFPRTIWEAMAHGLPVVATRVGSISLFLEESRAALLIAPRDSEALAQAIQEVLLSASLRKELMNNGFKLVKENTLEARAREMIAHLEALVSGQKPS